jgi:hypothetical protein
MVIQVHGLSWKLIYMSRRSFKSTLYQPVGIVYGIPNHRALLSSVIQGGRLVKKIHKHMATAEIAIAMKAISRMRRILSVSSCTRGFRKPEIDLIH